MYPAVHAQTRPDHPALVMSDGPRTTYRELERSSRRLARLLRELGAARGDTLAIVLENRLEWATAMWAGMRIGLYVAPLNRHLTATELGYVLGDCAPAAIVTSRRCAPAVEEAVAIAGLRTSILVAEELDARLRVVDGAPLADERLGARMLYSSGTTGRPKGIRQPLRDLHPADAPPRLGPLVERMGIDEQAVFLSPAPTYHAAPFTFLLIVQMLGGTVVSLPRFDAEDLLRVVEEHGVTHLQVVPTMLRRLLRLPEEVRARHDLSSLRVVVTSGAPCARELKAEALAWLGPIVHEYYGASEGYGQTHVSPQEALERPGTVGRALKGEIHVTDADGVELPPGEVGRIWFAGTDPVRYHGDEEKSRRARNDRCWTTIGDLGHVDEDGFLFLAGRESHTIISGGVNVYPAEVEEVLEAHPAVADVAVIGVPDDDLGEAVRAVVQLRDGAVESPELADELVAWCRERLAGFKRPRGVDVVASLPRTPTGKLLKDEVRRPYWERAGV